jgi:hypothetical protein
MAPDEMTESYSEEKRGSLVGQAAEAAGSRISRVVDERKASNEPNPFKESVRNQIPSLPEQRLLTVDRIDADHLGPVMTISDNLVAREPKFHFPPLAEVENKNCHGQPHSCHADASSDGVLNIFQSIIDHGADVWGFAGAGFWYTAEDPGRTELVELRGIISWEYNYELVVATDTAHSGGEFGVKVHSWDSQGQDYREENTHVGLWAYGCDFWDPHHRGSDAAGPTNVNHTFQFIPGRSYLCVGYIWGYSDANGSPGGQASTEIIARSPWLVTQDWVRP